MGSAHLTEDQLRRYFVGEGDNEEAGIVEEHLLTCDQCARVALHIELAVNPCQGAREQGSVMNN